MTDEPRSPSPAPDDDAGRDDELTAVLAVPPLDETTRRRLVRTALAAADDEPATAPAPPRSVGRMGAALGVAAALLVGAVVGAVVVTRPDEPDTPTAARAPSTVATTSPAGAAPAPQSAEDSAEGETVGQPPQELGDLGTAEGDDGLRQAINAAFQKGAAERSTAASAAIPCRTSDPSVVGLVRISATATVNLDSRSVAVLVGTTPAGEEEAVVLDAAQGCAILRRVKL